MAHKTNKIKLNELLKNAMYEVLFLRSYNMRSYDTKNINFVADLILRITHLLSMRGAFNHSTLYYHSSMIVAPNKSFNPTRAKVARAG